MNREISARTPMTWENSLTNRTAGTGRMVVRVLSIANHSIVDVFKKDNKLWAVNSSPYKYPGPGSI